MKSALKWSALGCGGLLLLLTLLLAAFFLTGPGKALLDAMNQVVATDELDGKSLETGDAVEDYLAAHPDRYALAAWDVGDEANGVFHDADTPWPLASTVKIVPLALISEELAAGRWSRDDPMPEIERFYLPGTDGDAHPKALAADAGHTVGGALRAMIAFSDNAATDAFLFRLGRARFANDAGLAEPHPLSGDTLLAAGGYDGGSVDDDAWAAAATLPRAGQVPRTSIAEQAQAARTLDNKGTARAFGRLMEKLFTDDGDRYAAARAELQWPMAFPSNQRDYRVFGTKGGSLVGVLTGASYTESNDGQRRVFVLFLHDVPFATWVGLTKTFAHQQVGRRATVGPDGLQRLRDRLKLPR